MAPKRKSPSRSTPKAKSKSKAKASPRATKRRKSPSRQKKRKSPSSTKQWKMVTSPSSKRRTRTRSPVRDRLDSMVKVRTRSPVVYVLSEEQQQLEPSPLLLGVQDEYSPVRTVTIRRPMVRSVIRPISPTISQVSRPRREASILGQGCTQYKTERGCQNNSCYWTGTTCLTP